MNLSIIKTIANNVVKNTNFDISEIKDTQPSQYNMWDYNNSILCDALSELGIMLNEQEFTSYKSTNINFYFKYLEYIKLNDITPPYYIKHFYVPTEIWHCGLIATVAELQKTYPTGVQKEALQVFEAFLATAPKLEDGTLCRIKNNYQQSLAVQIDDIYMLVPFWIHMWKLTNDTKYLESAIQEVFHYYHYLWDEKDLLMHCIWIKDTGKVAAHYWGRGVAWFIMAITYLLHFLPENHAEKEKLLEIYKEVIDGLIKYQNENGLWRQVLNNENSYYESSCSGMFTYCILKGVNKGWLDKSYKTYGLKGWDGLLSMVTKDYKIKNSCVGTDMSDDINYYLTRETEPNGLHAIGPFLLSAAEILYSNNH